MSYCEECDCNKEMLQAEIERLRKQLEQAAFASQHSGRAETEYEVTTLRARLEKAIEPGSEDAELLAHLLAKDIEEGRSGGFCIHESVEKLLARLRGDE